MENKLKGAVLVEYVKDVLIDHGTPFLPEDLPDDEFDCCIREIGHIIWQAAIAEAKEATTGVYSSNGINEVIRKEIDKIEDPFEEKDTE